MIKIEQVLDLDEKVSKTVKLIESLREENQLLKTKLEEYRTRVDSLEKAVYSYQTDQSDIEAGVKNAVTTLDRILSNHKPNTTYELPPEKPLIIYEETKTQLQVKPVEASELLDTLPVSEETGLLEETGSFDDGSFDQIETESHEEENQNGEEPLELDIF